MTCPNSTESGCRCVEHHPGLIGHRPQPGVNRAASTIAPRRSPASGEVVLEVVTAGSRKRPVTGAEREAERRTAVAREGCAACGGDAARCQLGTGAPHFRRLAGCAAWADDGHAAGPARAPRAPRQPWEPRAA